MGLKQCPKCDRQFTKAEHLKRHQRSHTQERPYECPLCKKRFARRRAFQAAESCPDRISNKGNSDVLLRHSRCHKRAYSAPMSQQPQSFQDFTNPVSPNNHGSMNDPGLAYPTQSLDHGHIPQHGPPVQQIHSISNIDPALELSVPPPIEPTPQQWMPPHPTDSHNHHPANSILSPNQQSLYPMNVANDETQRPQPRFAPFAAENLLDYGNGMTPSNVRNLPAPGATVTDDSTNALQWWLDQSDSLDLQGGAFNLEIGTGSGMFTPIPDDIVFRASPLQFRALTEGSTGGRGIPIEQYNVVKNCWPTHPNQSNQLRDDLWHSLFSSSYDNIFTTENYGFQGLGNSGDDSTRRRFDEACRLRLRKEFGQGTFEELHESEEADEFAVSSSHSSTKGPTHFPPVELLDIALNLYFRNYHSTVPFIHVPTFDPSATHPSMLFAICLIGLSILGTSGARKFVASAFPVLLQKVCAEFAQNSTQNRTVTDQLALIATACLTVNLAGVTGDKSRISSAQFLYSTLYSFSTQYGIFGANKNHIITELYGQVEDIQQRWTAWSRIESTKRLIISLIMLDTYYSNYMFNMPAIRGESIHFILPCEDALFEAETASKWNQLLSQGKNIHAPVISTQITDSFPIRPSDHFEPFSMYSLLTFLNLRLYEAYHRLILPSPQSNNGSNDLSAQTPTTNSALLVPSTIFARDFRARSLTPLVLSLSATKKDLNSMALWNHLCLLLTSDMRTFELAAGYEGKDAAEAAFADIAVWARTPAARRACLHSAQVYAVVSNRKISDAVRVRLDTVTSVFVSALVLGFYLCMAPPLHSAASSPVDPSASSAPAPAAVATTERFELSDPVDWTQIGDVGLVAAEHNNSNGRRQSEVEATTTMSSPTKAAISFILHGSSPISFNGDKISSDYHSARRVLLEYASLMEGMGKWSSKTSSQVLHVLADTIMQAG